MSDQEELERSIRHYLRDVKEVMGRLESVCGSLEEGADLFIDGGFAIDDNLKSFIETCQKDAHTMEKFSRSMSIGARLMLGFIKKGDCSGV